VIEHCQHGVDIKGFKGKGASRDFLAARDAVDDLVRQMMELAQRSRERPIRWLVLCVHRRSSSGQVCLRWRGTGYLAKHVPWGQVGEYIKDAHFNERQWYEQADTLVQRLNYQMIAARFKLKQMRAVM
jgi:hypothetical protein